MGLCMLQWLRDRYLAKNPIIAPHATKKSPANETVWLHLWNTAFSNGVGHAAIQVGGDQPKLSDTDDGRYMSLWPEYLPSCSLTAIIPTLAGTAGNLAEDMRAEGDTQNKRCDFDTPSFKVPLTKPESTTRYPDKSIQIKHLDTVAMKVAMDKQNEAIQNGRTVYQLFPNIRPVEYLLHDGPALISHDPIDTYMWVKEKQSEEATLSEMQPKNCTTFARDILRAGGMQLNASKWRPWGITPDELGQEVEREVSGHPEWRAITVYPTDLPCLKSCAPRDESRDAKDHEHTPPQRF